MRKLFSAAQYRDEVVDFSDSTFQMLAAQISANYLQFIKTRVIPELGEFSTTPLRELRTLMAIAQFDTPIRGKQISNMLSYDPASVTRSTRWLIENDFVYTDDNSQDARSVFYGLTPKGVKLTELYREVSAPAIANLNQAGPSQPSHQEILQALSVLEKVRDRSQLAVKLGAEYKRAKRLNRDD